MALAKIDRLTAKLNERTLSAHFNIKVDETTYLTTAPVVSKSRAIWGIEGTNEPLTKTRAYHQS